MSRLVTRALSAIAIVCAAGASHANLLSNGSFETGTFAPPSNQTMSLNIGSTAITGWTVGSDLLAWIGTGNPWSLAANDGDRFLDLTDYSFGAPFGGVAQTITITAGATYSLSFDLGSSNRWGRPSAILASAGGTSTTFTSALVGGVNDWEHMTMKFVASGPSTTISLRGATGQNYIGLDNASVDFVSGVPEPDTWAMSLAGLIFVGGMARLRRRRDHR